MSDLLLKLQVRKLPFTCKTSVLKSTGNRWGSHQSTKVLF